MRAKPMSKKLNKKFLDQCPLPKTEDFRDDVEFCEHLTRFGLSEIKRRWVDVGERYLTATALNGFIRYPSLSITCTRSQACHGGIRSDRPIDPENDCVYTDTILISMFQIKYFDEYLGINSEKDVDKRIIVEYYDWLLNHSPWRDTFVTKDPEMAFEIGVGHRMDRHNALVIGGAIAFRHGWEQYVWLRNVWTPLVKGGMNGTVAFFLGQSGRKKKDSLSFFNAFAGHMAIHNIYPSMVPMVNALRGVVVKDETFEKLKSYRAVNIVWTKGCKFTQGSQNWQWDRITPRNAGWLLKLLNPSQIETKDLLTDNNNIFEVYRSRYLRENNSGIEFAIPYEPEKKFNEWCVMVNNEVMKHAQ